MIGVDLALHQIWHNLARIALTTLLLAAMTTPILIVWGIKTGQIDTLLTQMRSDPANLEILLNNDTTLTADDLARLRAAPGLGYFEPTSRGLSVRIYLSRQDGSGRMAASLLPSTAGDPLLEALMPPTLDEVYVSKVLAEDLGVAEGDEVLIRTIRTNSSVLFSAPARIVGIRQPAQLPGQRLLVHPQLIKEVEGFLEGFGVPRLGIEGETAAMPFTPANARIYASSLENVVPLAGELSRLGFFVRAQNANVARMLELNRLATDVFRTLGWMAAIGALLGLWSGLSLNLAPQRRNLALLRLMGAGDRQLLGYVVTLGLGIGSVGIVLTLLTTWVASVVLNGTGPTGIGATGPTVLLPAGHLLAFAGVGILVSLTTGLAFGLQLLNIQPSEVLREEST